MPSIREQEAADIAIRQAKMEAEDREIREQIARVARKALAYTEKRIDDAEALLEKVTEPGFLETVDEKERAALMHKALTAYGKVFDGCTRLASVIFSKAKGAGEEKDGAESWRELLAEIRAARGNQPALPPPREIVVKPEKAERREEVA
jgi:hypothetical protein